MPAITTDIPGVVYDRINALIPAMDEHVYAECQTRITAMTDGTSIVDIGATKQQNETYGNIKANVFTAIRKHNSFRREDKVYLTLLESGANKINNIILAAYSVDDYEDALNISINLSSIMETAVLPPPVTI